MCPPTELGQRLSRRGGRGSKKKGKEERDRERVGKGGRERKGERGRKRGMEGGRGMERGRGREDDVTKDVQIPIFV